MSVHKKLMQARMDLQSRKLNKSGHNKFAGYQYFELGDFLPAVNEIFNTLGLCGVVSYGQEIATLTITDIDDGKEIVLTSPMAEANLKGCHPIQNLGAVETYTRRYLWVTAMEIVEHDAIDAGNPKDTKEPKHPLDAPVYDELTPERIEFIKEQASVIVDFHTKGLFDDAFVTYDNISDSAERLKLWDLLKPNSEVRSKLKLIATQKRQHK